MFLSGGDVGKSCSDVMNMKDMPFNCCKLMNICLSLCASELTNLCTCCRWKHAPVDS